MGTYVRRPGRLIFFSGSEALEARNNATIRRISEIPSIAIFDRQAGPTAPVDSEARQPPLIVRSDARSTGLADNSVDLVVTSPPYWRKRDYGIEGQIGQEATPQDYVTAMLECLSEWRRVLRPTGSVFMNIGDTYFRRSLANIPGRVEIAAADEGWRIRNRIIWAKDTGMPEPAKDRLANRHECIIHLTPGPRYYYDLFGYSERYGNGSNGANPGDVWRFNPGREMGPHLAPFPPEIAARAITLACPMHFCSRCGSPRERIVERTMKLDETRPQARRAMELAKQGGLTPAHIAAVQAFGVSDVGKARLTQNGTDRNSPVVRALAAEAKQVLNGYFREFTFALRETVGWSSCDCRQRFLPGVVLDPFMGTGTTLRTATDLGRSAVGVDLAPGVDPGAHTKKIA